MKLTLLLCLSIIFGCGKCFAQNDLSTTALNRISMALNDTVFVFYTEKIPDEMSFDNDKEYYWYKNDSIYKTQSGADGKLLNGKFVSYFPNKALFEQGSFYMGLKHGIWKTWFPNGKLHYIATWKNGKKEKSTIEYDSNGNLILRPKMKKEDTPTANN